MKNDKEKILKQTLPGRLKAKEIGKPGGRPKKLVKDKIKLAEDLYSCSNKPIVEICKELKISRPTFYAFLKERDLF